MDGFTDVSIQIKCVGNQMDRICLQHYVPYHFFIIVLSANNRIHGRMVGFFSCSLIEEADMDDESGFHSYTTGRGWMIGASEDVEKGTRSER